MTHSQDERFMRACFSLAKRGAMRVSPNPMVGCVIVRDGRAIAEGWHRHFGGPHAEREALQKAGPRAKGSTLYVNLEPCCHWGKTPPCTESIIRAGIKRVVTAIKDPNPLVSGKGLNQLRKHGIAVTVGVLSQEAKSLNKAFIKWMSSGLPYVTMKAAMTLDGKICTKTGRSRWISSPASRTWVHRRRSCVDAVLVGTRTVMRDDPTLTSHGEGRNPLRVVVDGRLSIPLSARIFNKGALTLVAASTKVPPHKLKRLEKKGIKVISCQTNKDGRIDLKNLLKILGRMFVSHVFVEGGGELNASFIESGLVDEVVFFIAPKIFGGREARTPIEGRGVDRPQQALNLKWNSLTRIGPDLLVCATPV